MNVFNESSMYIYTFIQPENKRCVELYCIEKSMSHNILYHIKVMYLLVYMEFWFRLYLFGMI